MIIIISGTPQKKLGKSLQKLSHADSDSQILFFFFYYD